MFQWISDFFSTVYSIISTFFQGILNLGKVTNDAYQILSTWNLFVPTSVAAYLGMGLVLTIVLVLIGRANNK